MTFNCLGYKAPNGRLISSVRWVKDVEGSGRDLKRERSPTRSFSQAIRLLSRDLNPDTRHSTQVSFLICTARAKATSTFCKFIDSFHFRPLKVPVALWTWHEGHWFTGAFAWLIVSDVGLRSRIARHVYKGIINETCSIGCFSLFCIRTACHCTELRIILQRLTFALND
jgi:hypothetical protein